MPSSTVENYVKQLYLAQQANPNDELVPIGRLATLMSVVPGTATTMVKALADSGLVRYESRTGARLTPGGERLALHVLRRHRLMELFLVKVLGMDWSEVHDEADILEHAISDKVLERIDHVLGYPTADPHGDPIPNATGEPDQGPLSTLADCTAGQTVLIVRMADQDPQFLRFANDSGLTPGAKAYITDRNEPADSITVTIDPARPVVIGSAAARRILVSTALKAP